VRNQVHRFNAGTHYCSERAWPPGTVRFAAPLWCPPPVGLDRHLRGLSGSSPRSVLIKICANKKIGEERRGDYPEAAINLEYEGKTNLKSEIDLKCEGKTLKTGNQPDVRAVPEDPTRC
jgi:hypothetical protein